MKAEAGPRAESRSHTCICAREAEKEQKAGLGYRTSRPTTTDPFPSVKPHLLKGPQPSQTVPPTRDQVFKSLSQWEALHIQTITVVLTTTVVTTQGHS